jgi:hypothetical protein
MFERTQRNGHERRDHVDRVGPTASSSGPAKFGNTRVTPLTISTVDQHTTTPQKTSFSPALKPVRRILMAFEIVRRCGGTIEILFPRPYVANVRMNITARQ